MAREVPVFPGMRQMITGLPTAVTDPFAVCMYVGSVRVPREILITVLRRFMNRLRRSRLSNLAMRMGVRLRPRVGYESAANSWRRMWLDMLLTLRGLTDAMRGGYAG